MTMFAETASGAPEPRYDLTSKYNAVDGSVHVSGIQAVIRGLFDQLRADQRQQLRTAAFVSGYPGSPLAGFDRELASALRMVDDVQVNHQPGVNEELAASAVMGSQLVSTQPSGYDGVIGFWYGKGPGLDRSVDAFRHAVFAGASVHGGAVALVGDDPQAKSSTIPSASETICVDLRMPVLYPADLADCRAMVPYAVELSRSIGGWVAIKIATAVADSAGTVGVGPAPQLQPIDTTPAPVSGHLLSSWTMARETLVMKDRVHWASHFASVNPIDHFTADPDQAWITIAAAGPSYLVVHDALAALGLDVDQCASLGVRVVRLGMIHPLADATVARMSDGVESIIVIEERRNVVEQQLLSRLRRGPAIVGWYDEDHNEFVPGTETLTVSKVARLLHQRLSARIAAHLSAPPSEKRLIALNVEDPAKRPPWFCPGCPHSTSTQVPAGAKVGAGIGCTSMILGMPEERVGDIATFSQMGGEGAPWIGMAPFVDINHFFQNLGDGTYAHSGQLAIRAAVGANVNITYKLLYNGHVAMTGGQHAVGSQPVGVMVQQLISEGVAKVVVTTSEPKGYARKNHLPSGVEVRDRADIIAVQEELAKIPGVTVLVHDQLCATEIRRARTRGLLATPTDRIVINERVCEGCGDCQTKSNCLALVPVPTMFGLKTAVDANACTDDRSCLAGDCPSFSLVKRPSKATAKVATKATSKRAAVSGQSQLTEPVARVSSAVVRFAGVGGNGVTTAAHLLGTAALLDGLKVRGLDQTGMAQKGGGVVSDVIITPGDEAASKLDRVNWAIDGGVDLLIAADPVIAQTPNVLLTLDDQRTIVIGSTEVSLSGDQLSRNAATRPDRSHLSEQIDEVTRRDANTWVDGATVRDRLSIVPASMNLVLVGVAFQRGLLPVSAAALRRAIELNATAVAANLAAFEAGRMLGAGRTIDDITPAPPATASTQVASAATTLSAALESTIATIAVAPSVTGYLRALATELVAYQNEALARRFIDRVAGVANAVAGAAEADAAVTNVAFGLHKLMAYKDEYEVARLLLTTSPDQGPTTWLLHPPMLRAMGMKRKIRLGPWAKPVMATLAKGKKMRGKAYDPFARAEVRKVERRLIVEFEDALDTVINGSATSTGSARVSPGHARSAELLARLGRLPDLVRGYEHVKLANVENYRVALDACLTEARSKRTNN